MTVSVTVGPIAPGNPLSRKAPRPTDLQAQDPKAVAERTTE